MEEIIQNLGGTSYFGIFGISVLANIFIPVPEEITLLALGYLSRAGELNLFLLIPIVMTGLLLSDIGMYFLSHKKNKLVTYFYEKFFAKRIEENKEFIDTHLNKVIFFSRFLMQLRFLGPFLAGQKNVPFKKFIKYELLALMIYVPLVLWMGWYFHSRVENIAKGVGLVRNILLIVIGTAILASILVWFKKKFFKQTKG